ncbi:MAG TPA: SIS domain-containing protein [Ottowia sp.]|uniref:SIS domain-containing protein n=1 Tax=Ottowia sp. TaxID=1898956 RepID=UPI002CCB0B62|nr:SIS domain-containing protein [Ottowia sp.]MCZ2089604.1 SIS domain-containing protein [Burkholderiales bacterium]HNE60800.1 SIS domain-containing protein [Ottowia sp.]HNI86244.1 SIS domain-containing protein [Ottowia sp.]HNJ45993.1 SIS domain-containing protein [Ottowia sp.]HNK54083.1 SIS domain-containing protein [Ottowia sp.]
MPEPRTSQQFIDSADLKYQWAQTLARPIDEATQALLACITGGGKLMVCGNGASGALAQYLVALLVGGLERARPELPALALGADAATLTAVARRGEYADVFAAQVRALGNPGDALLLLSTNGNTVNLVRAAQAAHERDMCVIALSGRGGGELGRMLRDTDVHVCVPHERTPRIHEAHQLVLHCLCDGLDLQLLGHEESSE